MWKHSDVQQQASSHISQPTNYSYFTEQARRAGYIGQELRVTQHERFGDHHHPQHPHPSFPAPDSREMRREAAIQTEIQNERIRGEIIKSEIVRLRCVLEAETRRDKERELALHRGNYGFPFGSSSVVGSDSLARAPQWGTRVESRSLLEERIVMSLAEQWFNVRR